MPESCVRDARDTAAMRQQRAEAQARDEQAAQAQLAARQAVDLTAAARNLGQTPLGADGQTLMGTILGGLGAI